MLEPKEKAKELINKYYHLFSVELENTIDYREAKQCALITIIEMLELTKKTIPSSLAIWTDEGYFREETTHYDNYLIEVKNELEKL